MIYSILYFNVSKWEIIIFGKIIFPRSEVLGKVRKSFRYLQISKTNANDEYFRHCDYSNVLRCNVRKDDVKANQSWT